MKYYNILRSMKGDNGVLTAGYYKPLSFKKAEKQLLKAVKLFKNHLLGIWIIEVK